LLAIACTAMKCLHDCCYSCLTLYRSYTHLSSKQMTSFQMTIFLNLQSASIQIQTTPMKAKCYAGIKHNTFRVIFTPYFHTAKRKSVEFTKQRFGRTQKICRRNQMRNGRQLTPSGAVKKEWREYKRTWLFVCSYLCLWRF
jgi:hypothetical protein